MLQFPVEVRPDNIIFETDSPYLSPDRGKQNEPANVKYIAQPEH